MKYKQDLLAREEQLNTLIEICNRILKRAPQGSLKCKQVGKGNWYYYKLRKDKEGKVKAKYLGESDNYTAARLAEKDYAKRILKLARKERALIGRFLKSYMPQELMEAYKSLSEGRKLLIRPLSDLDIWADGSWEKPSPQDYSPYRNNLIFRTKRGELVRSKTELIIADLLYEYGLDYIYEKTYYFEHSTGSAIVDFTVISRSGKVYYWEHFGRMDDPDYVESSFMYKMDRYAKDGIFPGKNLIVSFENGQLPLSTIAIRQIIEYYLL